MSGICQITCCSLPGSVDKMHYLRAVKWALCYSFKAIEASIPATIQGIYTHTHTLYIHTPAHSEARLCDLLASVLPYRSWQILSGCREADLQPRCYFLPWHTVWGSVFLSFFFFLSSGSIKWVLNARQSFVRTQSRNAGLRLLSTCTRIPVLLNHVVARYEQKAAAVRLQRGSAGSLAVSVKSY